MRSEIIEWNEIQRQKQEKKEIALYCLNEIKKLGFESNELYIFCNSFIPEPYKQFSKLPEPQYISENIDKTALLEIETQIKIENQKAILFAQYEMQLKQYNEWIESGKKARENKENANLKVKEIENRKKEMIKTANLPEGFEFSENGLLYNGFELSRSVQSSSALYIAGLKLATLNIGDLRAIHFDASFLDKISLSEVETFANSIDLQLLIERPDFDGGEIRYELINNQ